MCAQLGALKNACEKGLRHHFPQTAEEEREEREERANRQNERGRALETTAGNEGDGTMHRDVRVDSKEENSFNRFDQKEAHFASSIVTPKQPSMVPSFILV
jgi:hypothetical protein